MGLLIAIDKAAATPMILIDVKEVYADMIRLFILVFLHEADVAVTFSQIV